MCKWKFYVFQPHFTVIEAGPSILTTAQLRMLRFSFPARM